MSSFAMDCLRLAAFCGAGRFCAAIDSDVKDPIELSDVKDPIGLEFDRASNEMGFIANCASPVVATKTEFILYGTVVSGTEDVKDFDRVSNDMGFIANCASPIVATKTELILYGTVVSGSTYELVF
jgi:hypothetical protein